MCVFKKCNIESSVGVNCKIYCVCGVGWYVGVVCILDTFYELLGPRIVQN